jgi:tetratricopeptide (TPR) repeat protein
LIRRCTIGTYKRLPRPKRKAQDDFVNWTLHAVLWVKQHWKSALELVALGVVVFIVVVGATHYWVWRSNAAAEKFYRTTLLPVSSDEQVNALKEVVDDYLGTAAGKQALMGLGEIYLKRSDYALAKEQFRILAGKSRNHPMLFVAAMYKLAEAELMSGDSEAAAEAYLKVAADPHNLLSMDSRFKAAGVYEGERNYEEASKVYRQIIDEATEADLDIKDKSEERLIWLKAEGRI